MRIKTFDPKAIAELKHNLQGTVVLYGEDQYDKQRTPWLQVVDQRPALIASATCVEDISRIVVFAAENELPLAVQNTGHGISVACDGGVLLRLSGMKQVVVDAGRMTATVAPGVTSGELLAATEPHGLSYPTGQVSNVGITSYTLGGGYGWLGRKAGQACGWMRSATVVLSDGSIVTASTHEHPDLFWALRGGGGNFGVVANLTVELIGLQKVFGGMLHYDLEDAMAVLRFYREWAEQLGEETSTNFRLMRVPPNPDNLLHLNGTKTCAVGICCAPESQMESHMERIRSEWSRFKKPRWDRLAWRPYSEMSQFDGASSMTGSRTFSHVEFLQQLNDDVMQRLGDVADTRLPPIMQIEVQQLGGRAVTQPQQDMAVKPWEAPYLLHLVTPAVDETLDQLALATNEAFSSLGPVYTGEVSYNFLRGDQQDRVPAAFGPHRYSQLQAIKRMYDKDNFFHHNLNIPA